MTTQPRLSRHLLLLPIMLGMTAFCFGFVMTQPASKDNSSQQPAASRQTPPDQASQTTPQPLAATTLPTLSTLEPVSLPSSNNNNGAANPQASPNNAEQSVENGAASATQNLQSAVPNNSSRQNNSLQLQSAINGILKGIRF